MPLRALLLGQGRRPLPSRSRGLALAGAADLDSSAGAAGRLTARACWACRPGHPGLRLVRCAALADATGRGPMHPMDDDALTATLFPPFVRPPASRAVVHCPSNRVLSSGATPGFVNRNQRTRFLLASTLLSSPGQRVAGSKRVQTRSLAFAELFVSVPFFLLPVWLLLLEAYYKSINLSHGDA